MKLILLLLVLALQTAWILGTTLVQERALAGGKLVLLETRPADLRDLLRDDYVILNYKISDVALRLFSPALTNELAPGETVYVALEPRGQFYEVVQASTHRITPTEGQIVLKGHIQSWWNNAAQTTQHLDYGLERYYVREDTGNPRGKITVQAAVPESGQARIEEVFVDGKPYSDAMKGAAR